MFHFGSIAISVATVGASMPESLPVVLVDHHMKQLTQLWTTLLVFSCMIASHCHAQTATGFLSKIHVDADGKQHRYVVFVPHKMDDKKRPPLMMFLHGSGERGDNGIDQIMVGLGPALWKIKRDFPFVVVFPQCRKESNWKVDSPDGQRALAILKATAAEYNTDPDRVYLTGLSMGGSGTWSIIDKHPQMFAAVVPMCSRPDSAAAKKFVDVRLPIWNFCGDKDREATVAASRLMHKTLLDQGGSPRYTEYPGVGHNCWDNAYGTPELYTWLLEQSRSQNAVSRVTQR